VTLSAGNDWYHEWTKLDKKLSWSVIELGVPEGWVSTSSVNGTTTYITNTYKGGEENNPDVTPATVILAATKVYNGHAPNSARFRFALTDINGTAIQTKSNNDAGAVQFDPLTFSMEGTYVFKIHEINAGIPVLNYDDAVYTATITVSLNAEKTAYVATLTYSTAAGIPIFYNTSRPPEDGDDESYEEIDDDDVPQGDWVYDDDDGEWVFIPEDDPPLADWPGEDSDLPKTSDTTTVWELVLLIGAMLVSITGIIFTANSFRDQRKKHTK
jgi:pilin isopeptide linkage protein